MSSYNLLPAVWTNARTHPDEKVREKALSHDDSNDQVESGRNGEVVRVRMERKKLKPV